VQEQRLPVTGREPGQRGDQVEALNPCGLIRTDGNVIGGGQLGDLVGALAFEESECLAAGDRRDPWAGICGGTGSCVAPGAQDCLLGGVLGEVTVQDPSCLAQRDRPEAAPVPRRVDREGSGRNVEIGLRMLNDETS
jgi:hypothetical protein